MQCRTNKYLPYKQSAPAAVLCPLFANWSRLCGGRALCVRIREWSTNSKPERSQTVKAVDVILLHV